jgi:hypothetical protein
MPAQPSEQPARHPHRVAERGWGQRARAWLHLVRSVVRHDSWRQRDPREAGLAQVYRVAVFLAGLLCIAAGVALSVLPGPLRSPRSCSGCGSGRPSSTGHSDLDRGMCSRSDHSRTAGHPGGRVTPEGDCIDAVHLLAWTIIAGLHRSAGPQPSSRRRVLLACTDGERHCLASRRCMPCSPDWASRADARGVGAGGRPGRRLNGFARRPSWCGPRSPAPRTQAACAGSSPLQVRSSPRGPDGACRDCLPGAARGQPCLGCGIDS